jgi:hypothetical protein
LAGTLNELTEDLRNVPQPIATSSAFEIISNSILTVILTFHATEPAVLKLS